MLWGLSQCFLSIQWQSVVSSVVWTSTFSKSKRFGLIGVFLIGSTIPLNLSDLFIFGCWTSVKRSLSSQSFHWHKLIKRRASDFRFHSSFIVMIFSRRFVFDRQLILLHESAKLQHPSNKVPLVLLNISLPALLFQTPPLFHALIKETERRRMKKGVIKMRSDSRFQPFVMNIA